MVVVSALATPGVGHAATDVSTIGIARPESSDTKLGWHLRNSNSTGGTDVHFTFGSPKTGFPIVGDWNGDGKDTIGIVRDDTLGNLEWNLRNSNGSGGADRRFTYGSATTGFPVTGDWNG